MLNEDDQEGNILTPPQESYSKGQINALGHFQTGAKLGVVAASDHLLLELQKGRLCCLRKLCTEMVLHLPWPLLLTCTPNSESQSHGDQENTQDNV